MDREGARTFLEGLRDHLGQKISRTEVDQWLEGRDRERSVGKHIQYEGLFLDDFVLRNVADYLAKTCPQFDKRQRCEALLTESTLARKEELASASPASYQKHLFTKEVGTPLDTIVDLWWSASKKLPVSQSCPDWALRDPSPYRVVFEAKFFREGTFNFAQGELVRGIYQCFYYRAQPKIDRRGQKAGWDYDYACLFAYDASKTRSLVEAWERIPQMQDECWNAANIFVMVLPRT